MTYTLQIFNLEVWSLLEKSKFLIPEILWDFIIFLLKWGCLWFQISINILLTNFIFHDITMKDLGMQGLGYILLFLMVFIFYYSFFMVVPRYSELNFKKLLPFASRTHACLKFLVNPLPLEWRIGLPMFSTTLNKDILTHI